MIAPPFVLENESLKVVFDAAGRITELTSKITKRSFLTVAGLEDNWKLLVLTDSYPVYYLAGREQTPVNIQQSADRIVFSYKDLVGRKGTYDIQVDFTAYLEGEEVRFDLKVTNNHTHRVREAWYPILGGFEGFEENGNKQIVHFAKSRTIEHDILHNGLPNAEYQFGVEGEVGQYYYPNNQMQWIDLYSATEGLYISSDDKSLLTTVFRLDKHPAEYDTSGMGLKEPSIFPPNTPRWLKIMIGKLTAIDPGDTWEGAPSVFWPHTGDWHVAAKHYRAWANTWMKFPEERPEWLKDYVGWHHIVGKTYLDEVYFNFEQYIDVMIEAQERCGVDTLMVYGHTNIGCEGSDVDISPAIDLGGPEGFKRMCDELHARGMKVMVFTHRQSAINIELPEYEHFKTWAITDRFGNARPEIWWKTTIEAHMVRMQHYEATGPVWARICPYCDEWWIGFRDEIFKLMELGLDGIQLDTIHAEAGICYSSHHGHKPGTRQSLKLNERLAWLRAEIRAVNPEFLLCGEEYGDWLCQYLDLPYSRYRGENGNEVYRYTFPEMKENCAVSAYGYHQVNKSMMLGMGMDIEIEGLKKTILSCPELMDYMKEIVNIRRSHSNYLMNGIFTDTLGAKVTGNVRYSVFESPEGVGSVVWNATDDEQTYSIQFDDQKYTTAILCQPFAGQQSVSLTSSFTLPPHTAAAIIAGQQA